MPRAHGTVPSALRNRNRVTNKTRLKIIRGNIEPDLLVIDEDDERVRVVSTAGVDAEDANVSSSSSPLSRLRAPPVEPSPRGPFPLATGRGKMGQFSAD